MKSSHINCRNVFVLSSIRTQHTPFPVFSVARFCVSQKPGSWRGGHITTDQVCVDQGEGGEVSSLAAHLHLGHQQGFPGRMYEQLARQLSTHGMVLEGWGRCPVVILGLCPHGTTLVLLGQKVELHSLAGEHTLTPAHGHTGGILPDMWPDVFLPATDQMKNLTTSPHSVSCTRLEVNSTVPL